MFRNIAWELEHGIRHKGGGGGSAEAPTMPDPVRAPAVKTGFGIAAKREANRRRARMALAGQSTMMAGGSMAGGTTGGKSLMGS